MWLVLIRQTLISLPFLDPRPCLRHNAMCCCFWLPVSHTVSMLHPPVACPSQENGTVAFKLG